MRKEVFAEGKAIDWKAVQKNPFYESLARASLDTAEQYMNERPQALPYSLFKLFLETGDRGQYEAFYFQSWRRMCHLAMAALLEGGTRYISALEDAMWHICDHFSWALPAHIRDAGVAEAMTLIDLFAAETGFYLGEICHLLGDRISPYVLDRVKIEVRRRVIGSFQENKFYWEEKENNWAAVCCAGVAAAFFYFAEPEEIDAQLDRFDRIMQVFLKSYGEDGVCQEGYSYWNYGFGFFTIYAQMVKEYTDGKIDYFKNPKVREMAKFTQKAFFSKTQVISFSDNPENPPYCLPLLHFLHRQYPEVEIPEMEKSDWDDSVSNQRIKFGWAIRKFAWTDPDFRDYGIHNTGTAFYPDAQWYIKTDCGFSFAAKGGHNNEPHNHNDIGSFILVGAADDLGSGEYTRQYFSKDGRYTYLVNSSRGHSVPIIDGVLQCAGKAFAGAVKTASDDTFSVEIAGAYALPNLQSLVRTFQFDNKRVALTDHYAFDTAPKTVVERLVSTYQPVRTETGLSVGCAHILFDAQELDCSISSEQYKMHNGSDKTAYLIDFAVKQPSAEFDVTLTFTV